MNPSEMTDWLVTGTLILHDGVIPYKGYENPESVEVSEIIRTRRGRSEASSAAAHRIETRHNRPYSYWEGNPSVKEWQPVQEDDRPTDQILREMGAEGLPGFE